MSLPFSEIEASLNILLPFSLQVPPLLLCYILHSSTFFFHHHGSLSPVARNSTLRCHLDAPLCISRCNNVCKQYSLLDLTRARQLHFITAVVAYNYKLLISCYSFYSYVASCNIWFCIGTPKGWEFQHLRLAEMLQF